MKKHDCALFDLDGVIVDTAKFHFLAWKKIASIFNYDLTSNDNEQLKGCLLYTSPSPRDATLSRMPSSA